MPIFKYRLFNNQSICNLTVDNQLSEMLYFNIKKIQFMIRIPHCEFNIPISDFSETVCAPH